MKALIGILGATTTLMFATGLFCCVMECWMPDRAENYFGGPWGSMGAAFFFGALAPAFACALLMGNAEKEEAE